MENSADTNMEPVVSDGPAPEELEDDVESGEDSERHHLESLRQQAGLGHITVQQRRELYNRFLEFETKLGSCSPQQQIFILAYLNDPSNAVAAGRAAGYSETSLRPHVSKLLHMDKIKDILALGNNIREDRTFITADRTLQELAIIGFSDITNFEVHPDSGRLTTVNGVPEHARRAVASAEFTTVVDDRGEGKVTTTFKTKIKMWNKLDALRMLALYQKLMRPDGNVTINATNEAGSQSTWVFGGQEIVL